MLGVPPTIFSHMKRVVEKNFPNLYGVSGHVSVWDGYCLDLSHVIDQYPTIYFQFEGILFYPTVLFGEKILLPR